MVDKVSTVLLKSLVAGEKPVVILSLNLNISVEKQFLEDLGNSPMSDGAASFALPDLGDMGLKADENGTSKFDSVDKKASRLIFVYLIALQIVSLSAIFTLSYVITPNCPPRLAITIYRLKLVYFYFLLLDEL